VSLVAPPPIENTLGRQGHYAGGASRLAAFAIDIGVVWLAYTVGAAILSLATQLVTGRSLVLARDQLGGAVVLVVWGFVYFAYQWTLNGKTVGMALLGLQVVQAGGRPLAMRQAVVRTLVLPLSFALGGMGLLGVLVHRQRRALHDLIAGTAVVYSWDARAARLRWLARTDRPHARPPTGEQDALTRRVGQG